jgi:hypothetical protein
MTGATVAEFGAAQAATPEGQSQLWARFAASGDTEAFCQSWLALQCHMFEGVHGALLLLGEPGQGPFAPMAVWPDPRRSMQHLGAAAQLALQERRGQLLRGGTDAADAGIARGTVAVAYPIEAAGLLCGVVVLHVAARSDGELQNVLRQVHWGSAWLEVLFRRRESERQQATVERVSTVLDLASAALCPGDFKRVAMSLANQVAARFACDRVSLGVVHRERVQLEAMSHTARFGENTNLARAIESAMDEAVDQQELIAWPALPGARLVVSRQHELLVRSQSVGQVLTLPLRGRERSFGALLLERPADQPFDAATVELLESLAAVIGPVLESQWLAGRPVRERLVATAREHAQQFVGPDRYAWKLSAALLGVLLVFFSFAKGDFRVAAKTTVEGEMQRALVAPFDGYVARAAVRAGDAVKQGQVIAELDDRDLQLEALRWRSEKEQHERKYREAMGTGDRAAMRIVGAQLAQAEAQLALVLDRLARTRLVAPYDGVVVSGDLSQRLGSPVQQGETMFEVAPLDAYRVILQVDERDVAWVAAGQSGHLRLSGRPHEAIDFMVTQVTPVSTAAEGRNFFRVEASLDPAASGVGPGMEGIGKIEAGRARLIWIWTRGLVDWLRLWIWSWTP